LIRRERERERANSIRLKGNDTKSLVLLLPTNGRTAVAREEEGGVLLVMSSATVAQLDIERGRGD
jgi:hypothetical protein